MKNWKVLVATAVLFSSVSSVTMYALGFKSQSLGKPTPVDARASRDAKSAKGGAKSGTSPQQGDNWDTKSYGTSWLRIRIEGEGSLIPLKPCGGAENCRVENDNGKEELRAFGLWVNLTKTNGKQNMCHYKFTFTPRRDGKLRVTFHKSGQLRRYPPEDPENHPEITKPYDNPDLHWGCFGDIRIETSGRARFTNGNFSNGLKGWSTPPRYTSNDKRTQQGMAKVKGDIPNGRAFRTTCSLSQVIEVQKDKDITISFWWAPDECFAALH